jgi:hypothetical protein
MDCVAGLPCELDDHPSNVGLKLPKADRTDWVQIDADMRRTRLHTRPRTIQNQTGWIVQLKWGAGEFIASEHADLDGMTDIGGEYLLDQD